MAHKRAHCAFLVVWWAASAQLCGGASAASGTLADRSDDWLVVGDLERPRWWDTDLLRRATMTAGYEQFWPLLDKLSRGQPVTVVGLGSSIVADYGGCYHAGEPDLDALSRRVARIPISYFRGCCTRPVSAAAEEHPPASEVGFMSLLMARINASWPHPDHLYVNSGLAAHNLHMLDKLTCLELELPRGIDLLVLESSYALASWSLVEPGQALEHLLRRLHRIDAGRAQPPAVILVNTAYVVEQGEPERCLSELCEAPDCDALDWSQATSVLRGEALLAVNESGMHAVAAAYGATSLSVVRFWSSLLRDDAPARLNMPLCELLGSVMGADGLHPMGPLGRLLFADLLTTQLLDALSHWRRARGARPGGELLLPPRWPRLPVTPGGGLVWTMRCYEAKAAVAGASSARAVRSPGLSAAGIEIVSNAGWGFVDWYTGREGKRKRKPGWQATHVGAKLRVALDTNFSGEGGGDVPPPAAAKGAAPGLPPAPAQVKVVLVEVGYLMSYEHMGVVQVTCVSGCECEQHIIDAHRRGADLYSATLAQPIGVTQHSRCVLEFEVLEQTSSGQHRFKLQRLVAKSRVPS